MLFCICKTDKNKSSYNKIPLHNIIMLALQIIDYYIYQIKISSLRNSF